jgi:hypothetical protein
MTNILAYYDTELIGIAKRFMVQILGFQTLFVAKKVVLYEAVSGLRWGEPKSCLGRIFNYKFGCFCYESNFKV